METREKIPAKRLRKKRGVVVNLCNCKYDVVFDCAEKMSWHVIQDEEDEVSWNLYWTDTSVSPERVMKMQQFQRINHFPGMINIARKAGLARHLTRMKNACPEEYNIFPQTWVLPADFSDFKKQFTSKKNKTFIIKPDAGSQGRGIYLTRKWENVDQTEPQVAQKYMHKPFTIDGLKFDMRVYVLVTSCDPLRIYIYRDGLVRLATESYVEPTGKNLDDICMHLTNYAINKNNENFVFNEDESKTDVGSKRSLIWFFQYLKDNGHDAERLWTAIGDLCIKTLISIQPTLSHMYHSCLPNNNHGFSCFEVLGLDIFIDHYMKPWLIEVNHSPSFTCDTPFDRRIKQGVILQVMKMLNLKSNDHMRHKKKMAEEAKSRLYSGVTQARINHASSTRAILNNRGFIGQPEKRNSFKTSRMKSSLDCKATESEEMEKSCLVEQKLLLRKKQEDYQDKNCGLFVRILPRDDEEEMHYYNRMLYFAREIYEDMTQPKVRQLVNFSLRPNEYRFIERTSRRDESKQDQLFKESEQNIESEDSECNFYSASTSPNKQSNKLLVFPTSKTRPGSGREMASGEAIGRNLRNLRKDMPSTLQPDMKSTDISHFIESFIDFRTWNDQLVSSSKHDQVEKGEEIGGWEKSLNVKNTPLHKAQSQRCTPNQMQSNWSYRSNSTCGNSHSTSVENRDYLFAPNPQSSHLDLSSIFLPLSKLTESKQEPRSRSQSVALSALSRRNILFDQPSQGQSRGVMSKLDSMRGIDSSNRKAGKPIYEAKTARSHSCGNKN